jgi:hypothetical protein
MIKAIRFVQAAILTLPFVPSAAGSDGQIYNYREKKDPPVFQLVTLAGGLYIAEGEWGANVGVYIDEDQRQAAVAALETPETLAHHRQMEPPDKSPHPATPECSAN